MGVFLQFINSGIRYEDNGMGALKVLGFAKGITYDCVDIPAIINNKPVVEIGVCAFKNSNIKEIILPYTIGIINRSAFENCVRLVSVEIMEDNENVSKFLCLKSGAFRGCSNLDIVDTWAKTVTIEAYCFANCVSLQAMIMNVYCIYAHAFKNCPQLLRLTFSKNATLFNGCIDDCGVKELYFEGNANIETKTIDTIVDKNVNIYCEEDSSLTEFSYLGCSVKTYAQGSADSLIGL